MTELRPGLLLFAYGCFLDPAILEKVIDMTLDAGWPARLNGWRLAFNKAGEGEAGEGAVANIEEAAACCVLGAVYRVPHSVLAKLDEFEGVPEHYRRATVWLEPLGRRACQAALAYVAQPRWVGADGLPGSDYLDALLRGARLHGLGDDYIAWLQGRARGEIQDCYRI